MGNFAQQLLWLEFTTASVVVLLVALALDVGLKKDEMALDFPTSGVLSFWVGSVLKGRDYSYAHACRLSLQNKFVGSTLHSKSPLPVQSLKILRFIPTSVALAGLVILR